MDLKYWSGLVKGLGFRGTAYWRSHRHLAEDGSFYELFARGVPHAVLAREGTSDGSAFFQVFVNRQYECTSAVGDPKLVIDCGANVGYASLFFLNRFPGAKVIAVEPDPGNFSLLRRNVARYGDRVRTVQAGIWSREAGLVVVPTHAGNEWAITVRECRDGEAAHVRGVAIDTLLRESGLDTIDILKVDIEGAEALVFSADCKPWLSRTRSIVIELHGDNCEKAFFGALSAYRTEMQRSFECVHCRVLGTAEAVEACQTA